jgi:hypothetical protein
MEAHDLGVQAAMKCIPDPRAMKEAGKATLAVVKEEMAKLRVAKSGMSTRFSTYRENDSRNKIS